MVIVEGGIFVTRLGAFVPSGTDRWLNCLPPYEAFPGICRFLALEVFTSPTAPMEKQVKHSIPGHLIPPSVPHENFLPPRKSPSVGLLMSLRQLSFPFGLPLFCEKQPSLKNSESIHAHPKSAALPCSTLWIRSLWWLHLRVGSMMPFLNGLEIRK